MIRDVMMQFIIITLFLNYRHPSSKQSQSQRFVNTASLFFTLLFLQSCLYCTYPDILHVEEIYTSSEGDTSEIANESEGKSGLPRVLLPS